MQDVIAAGDFLVSIHAPARGATEKKNRVEWEASVSIHAPARGATRLYDYCLQARVCFNPRTREGCDDTGKN